ncbi:MAG TPA: serine/threonine-protein kinase [Kofleriaceae bacterium]|nr:serine/threonine-protein kinase [Kofleriaceae bacterium]
MRARPRPRARALPERQRLAIAAAVAGALAAGVPAYVLGPNSAFAAIVALCLIAAAVLVRDGAAAWLLYVALAGSQAIACGLILAGVMPAGPDPPVALWVGDHSGLVHAAGQAFLQVVYLAGFLAGRSLQRRFRGLVRQIEESTRAAARREALLEEARADYRRALVAGRLGSVDSAVAVAPESSDASNGRASEEMLADRLDEPDLAAWLRASGPLSRADLRALIEDVSRELEELHGAGALHLDVRPRTIRRAPDPDRVAWRLVDAAAAQLEAARDPGGDPVALLAYAAPERLHGEHAGAPADLYGLAASIYAAVTGRDPFDAGDAAVRGAGAASGAPRDPRPRTGDDIALALRIGLATSPGDRFASAAELRRAFLGALDGDLDGAVRAAATELESRDPWRRAVPGPRRSGPEPRASESRPPTSEPTPTPTSTSNPSNDAWHSAYVAMIRGMCFATTALCLAGGAFLWVIAADRDLLHFSWVCLTGIVDVVWWHLLVLRRRPGSDLIWPWVVAATLTIGPALTVGLHSGFAAIVTVLLFAGGLFRGPVRGGENDRRRLVLAGVCVPHLVAFTLIAAGVLDDAGTISVFPPGTGMAGAVLCHACVLAVYATAFTAGRAVDRRNQALSFEVEAAARDAARAEALLVSAREELDRALTGDSGGLFSRLRLGAYDIGRLLGRGGVGEVYEARHAVTGQLVALKLLRRDRAAEAWHARRLRSEAAALRRVDSPHVARIVDGGDLDGDIPFLAMEFIPGTSLAAILRESGSITPATLGQLVRDVATGLDDVHRAGVLHLDVKPGNLIRGAADGWQLVDFGTAQLIDTGAAPPLVSGTPSYMSPEQARGAALDGRSDLYSFCLVLYRALTGRPAFAIRDPAEVEAAAAAGPPDPRGYAELSADLELVLRIGLATSPDDRFASAAELRDAFAAALRDSLPEPLRRRGAALLAREPWDSIDAAARRRAPS